MNNNLIECWSDLDELKGAKNLETVYLERNPLQKDPQYRRKIMLALPTVRQIDATFVRFWTFSNAFFPLTYQPSLLFLQVSKLGFLSTLHPPVFSPLILTEQTANKEHWYQTLHIMHTHCFWILLILNLNVWDFSCDEVCFYWAVHQEAGLSEVHSRSLILFCL